MLELPKVQIRSKNIIALCILFVFYCCSCSTGHIPAPTESELFQQSFLPWRVPYQDSYLFPGNEILIEGSEDPQINGSYRVSPTGSLILAYNVVVKTNGKTFHKLIAEIKVAYSLFSLNTNMQIRLKSKTAFVQLTGLIQKSGYKVTRSNRTVDEIILLAGGYKKDSSDHCLANQINIQQLGVKNTFPIIIQDKTCKIKFSDFLPKKWFGGEIIEVKGISEIQIKAKDSSKKRGQKIVLPNKQWKDSELTHYIRK